MQPAPCTPPPHDAHQPGALLPPQGSAPRCCVHTFPCSARSGWMMKFKRGPLDFQRPNICASNSRAARQLRCIPECQSHSTRTPHCSFLGEISSTPPCTFAKAFAQDADNLHHYSNLAYWGAQPDRANAWATLSLISAPPPQ